MNKRTTGDKIADTLAAATLAVCLLAIAFGAGRAEAAEANTGTVNLAATLKNAPAFQKVSWVVVRGRDTVKTSHAHSLSLDLVPGNYEARLECNGNNRSRSFTVSVGSNNSFVLACD
ncbi:MAG: hypothetical protein PHE17_16375 [Thiothrix sp.]|uniref:hypothetical protein n=1 Tax=Thiothrix sp. TaxID=1032 RepID=UPI0026252753|nr:hypothetical protein [Thiothrix sp.]MDD5394592.1 hypothetical protein [Thiothrix sp.]